MKTTKQIKTVSFSFRTQSFSTHVRVLLFLSLFLCGGLLNAQWTQLGNDMDSEAEGDQSGFSVSLSSDGTRVAIGAQLNDGNGTSAGHVRVYEESGGSWTQVGNDIDGEAAGDQSGASVSLSSDGTRLAIGGPKNDVTGTDAGHVRVYYDNSGVWTQVGNDINGEAAADVFGTSVSLSSDGTRVAIGASRNDDNGSNSGHVRVYYDNSGVWTQVGNDIDGEAAGDQSGISVSISSDGTRVAIGAWFNGDNGSNSGHVRVYDESGGSWSQVGSDTYGEAASDYSGVSVSLSSAGTRVAIGAHGNDGNGTSSGHVRIYSDAPLPVELSWFQAYAEGENVKLEWTTLSEVNNDYFTIERSYDGIDFKDIGDIKGAGESHTQTNYSFIDERPAQGINYYLLKQMDFDGTFEYSDIVSIDLLNFQNLVNLGITPNPIQNGTFTLSFSDPDFETGELSIFDAMGREVLSQRVLDTEMEVEIGELVKGVYFVSLEVDEQRLFERVVVQ